MHETRRLAEFVAATGYADLPLPVLEATKVYILDNLACGLLGSTTLWAEMVASLARESASSGSCSVFGRGWTTSPSYAALVNGTMIGSFESDHAFFQGSCHPSAAVFPASLAIAERDHLDGQQMMASVALGYELVCRVGLAATRAVEDIAGFHGPGTNAPFGGAAGAGKALGLDAQRLTNALGIAGSHAAGLLEFAKEGAMTKRIHVGRGAQMGLESALLAGKGFTGPSTVLEGERGFLRVYSPSPQPELLVEDLGQRYLLMDMTLKAYACHLSFHSVIDGIYQFRRKNPFHGTQVRGVTVVGPERMMENRFSSRRPTSVLGAQYSLPFSVAIALCRDIADPTVYSEDTLGDPQVQDLASRVELATDTERFEGSSGATGEVSLTIDEDAHTFSVYDWKGAPTDPYGYDDISDKFRRYAASCLSPNRIEEIIQRVGRLEHEGDVAELAHLLRTP